jgi:hypothetical protein
MELNGTQLVPLQYLYMPPVHSRAPAAAAGLEQLAKAGIARHSKRYRDNNTARTNPIPVQPLKGYIHYNPNFYAHD